ncbi:MAG: PorP/SprF family type IX secretion system membrane protein [Bacteroidia bacterium]|nr:PorP/SprF family type IX secretion system membrane protein [Bacteroidia bacterium]
MKKINYRSLLIILTLSSFFLKAQDIHFSQVCETPVFLSPANTGFFNGYTRAIANYRNQWMAMNNAYQTMAISVDGGLFKSKKHQAFMGVGLTIFRDQAGAAKLSQTNALVNISGLVKMGRYSAFSVGLAGGTMATNGNYNKLTYASQFNGNSLDPGLASGEIPYRQFTTVDVGAGLAYEFAKSKKDPDHDDMISFRISMGAFHLNKPVQEFGAGSFYKMPIKYVYAFTSVYDIVDTKFTITPTLVYQTQGNNNPLGSSKSYQEIFVGSYLKYRLKTGTKVTGEKTSDAIGFGLFYRRRDAIVPKFIVDLGDYSIGLAYDVNISAYTAASRSFGGFEVSLRYNNLASSLFAARKEFR